MGELIFYYILGILALTTLVKLFKNPLFKVITVPSPEKLVTLLIIFWPITVLIMSVAGGIGCMGIIVMTFLAILDHLLGVVSDFLFGKNNENV